MMGTCSLLLVFNRSPPIQTSTLELQMDLSVDEHGRTALTRAVFKGNDEMIMPLLLAGVDLSTKDKQGRTALYQAAKKGHTKFVRTLLNVGRDMTARKDLGQWELHEAANNGHAK